MKKTFDFAIIGSGVSGGYWAHELVSKGHDVLLIEAGEHLDKNTYPRSEIDANSKLYWSGGIEFNKSIDIGFLRPKVVGGGSIVNQALLDRFDEEAWRPWREQSKIDFFKSQEMETHYQKVEQMLSTATAAENILLALHAKNYAGMWRTGKFAFNKKLVNYLNLSSDHEIIGYLYVGTPSGTAKKIPKLDLDKFVTYWNE